MMEGRFGPSIASPQLNSQSVAGVLNLCDEIVGGDDNHGA